MNNKDFNLLLQQAKQIGLKTTVLFHNNSKQLLRNNPISINYILNVSKEIDQVKLGDVSEIIDKKYFIKKILLNGICPYQSNNSDIVIINIFKDKDKENEVLIRIQSINAILKQILTRACAI